MLIQQLPKTVGAVKRKFVNAYRGESDLLREYEFTNLCVLGCRGFLLSYFGSTRKTYKEVYQKWQKLN